MSVHVDPAEAWEPYDLEFVEPCLFGHEECSDVLGGPCTAPVGLSKAQTNVITTIAHHDGGICTPHIVRFMLNHGLSEGALSVTKRITELRRLGYPVHGGLRDNVWCEIGSHRHTSRVGYYLLDI